jgi:phenylacetate-CoA ligase
MEEYLHPKFETMPRDEPRELQLKRLKKSVKSVYDNVPLYRKRFDEAGVKPEKIKSLDDVAKLPFTFKKDLRDNYSTRMFSTPLNQVVRYHVSSGTTGKPTAVFYTKNDIKV